MAAGRADDDVEHRDSGCALREGVGDHGLCSGRVSGGGVTPLNRAIEIVDARLQPRALLGIDPAQLGRREPRGQVAGEDKRIKGQIEMRGEAWFYVADNDVFPETFINFLAFDDAQRELFMRAHGDVLTADYWRRLAARIKAGEVLEVLPYRPRRLGLSLLS